MRREILVPLDGSAGSEAVLAYAAGRATALGAGLRLLHVARPADALVEDGHVIRYADEEAARTAHDAIAYLTAAAAGLAGLPVEVVVRFGDPAPTIVQEAGVPGVVLVAMATRRPRGLARLVWPSVAERVARDAPVPVLLVTHGGQPAAPSGETPETAHVGQAPGDATHVRRRQFWCACVGRDVEVEFEEQGLLGLRSAVAVRSCSAADPPTAIECRRWCLDPTFRQPWGTRPLGGEGGVSGPDEVAEGVRSPA